MPSQHQMTVRCADSFTRGMKHADCRARCPAARTARCPAAPADSLPRRARRHASCPVPSSRPELRMLVWAWRSPTCLSQDDDAVAARQAATPQGGLDLRGIGWKSGRQRVTVIAEDLAVVTRRCYEEDHAARWPSHVAACVHADHRGLECGPQMPYPHGGERSCTSTYPSLAWRRSRPSRCGRGRGHPRARMRPDDAGSSGYR